MIKENINKIDFDLKNLFESVEIVEKSRRSEYFFEINAYASVDGKTAQVKVEISKPDLNNDNIKWSYYTNPVEPSSIIERTSNISTISEDIFEVLSKKKMESEYFESLQLSPINESSTSLVSEDALSSVLKSFGVNNLISEDITYHIDGRSPDKTYIYSKDLKEIDKINLTSKLESMGTKYVSIVKDIIKIKIQESVEDNSRYSKLLKFLSDHDFELYDGEQDLQNKFMRVEESTLSPEQKANEIAGFLDEKWGLYDGYQDVVSFLKEIF